jgi:mono/diheme cytochrome c family protein
LALPRTALKVGRTAGFAAGLAVIALLGLAGCGADGERRAVKFLPGMVEPVPYESYDASPLTDDGKALMLPPEGTVPVDHRPFPFGAEEADAIRAGLELVNPLEPTPEVLARGRKVFESKCQVCHGPTGAGDGPIIGHFPNPPNLTAEHARMYPDGRIFHVITRGQGLMASYAVQVLPVDRWAVIMYVRTIQRAGGEVAGDAGDAGETGGADGPRGRSR